MSKKLEALKNGICNGLICEVTDHERINASNDRKLVSKNVLLCGIYSDGNCVFHDTVESDHGFEMVKPHYFPLDYLTKPIRVDGYLDGKEFIPYDKLFFGTETVVHDQGKWFLEHIRMGKGHIAAAMLPTFITEAMSKMKINWKGLPPSDFIDASISKVYEPK